MLHGAIFSIIKAVFKGVVAHVLLSMAEQIKIKQPEIPVPIAETSPESIEVSKTAEQPKSSATTEQITEPHPPTSGTPATTPPNLEQVQRLADIERILEEDLSEIYFKLPATDQASFRLKGEETARQINTLLSATTIKLKQIIDAIRGWLQLIPGVSKFFLDQEAKIKADRLLKLHNDR